MRRNNLKMKNNKILILCILIVSLILILSGCIEQKKEINLTMAKEITSPVNLLPIVIYAKFNESVNGSVNFYIDDKFIGVANSNGSDVFIQYDKNLSAGEYTVKAIFAGNDKFSNASASTRLQILKHNTILSIGFEPEERIYFKDSLEISAQLNAEREGECANKEILLYADDKLLGKNLTNDECFVKFTIKGLNVGELNVKAEYEGNEIYKNAKDTKTINVISKIPVEIFSDSKEVEAKNKNVTITAFVKDYKGRDVNCTLKIMYNENLIVNLTAEHNTHLLDLSNWTLGTYRLQVIFDGTEIYENASKDVFVQIINKYNISGVRVKAEIPIEQIVNKKVSVYTDGSKVSEYCAYEFESIVDQKKGYRIQIRVGSDNEIFLGKNFGIITVKQGSYEMLPCHVFLCINKGINCSILEIIDTMGQLENLSIALDENVKGKPLAIYNDIIGAMGYVQSYFFKNKKEIYIKPYLIKGGKCILSPMRTVYQNLTMMETNDCNFKGIFIRNSDTRVMTVKDGKILIEGDENGLYVGGTILKWIIAPGYVYDLRIKKQNQNK